MNKKNYAFLKQIHLKGFSQVALCQKSEFISEPKLSRLINGFLRPNEQIINELASILELPTNEIRDMFEKDGN